MSPGFSTTGGSASASTTTSTPRAAATAAAMSDSFVSVAPGEYDTRSAPNCARMDVSRLDTDLGYMVVSVPCHVYVQLPCCAGSDVAPGPVTRMRVPRVSGSSDRSFFTSVTASSAARRLTAWNAGAPALASRAASGPAFSNRPRSSLSFRMRRTDSSMRASLMSPECTSASTSSMNDVLYGTMLMSMPALIAMRTASRRVRATCVTDWRRMMSSQSESTTPLKPSSPRRRSVRISLLEWTGTPLISPELTMIVRTPASIAARKGGSTSSRN